MKTLVKPIEKEDHFIEYFLPICKAFKPLFSCMTLFGIYHERRRAAIIDNANRDEMSATNGGSKHTSNTFGKFYHLFIMVAMIMNAVRYIPSFWVGMNYMSDITISRVIVCAWLIQSAITGIILFIMCENNNQLPEFVYMYNQLMTDRVAKEIKLNSHCGKLKAYSMSSVLIGVPLVLANTIGIFALSFMDKTNSFRASVVNPFDHESIPLSILMITTFLFESAVWILPVFFFICISLTLSLQFRSLNFSFSQAMKDEASGQTPMLMDCLKSIRRKHHQLCKAVEVLDGGFKYLIMNVFGINIFITMFIMYQLISGKPLDTLTFVINLFWFVCEVSIILVIAFFSTNLTYWVRS